MGDERVKKLSTIMEDFVKSARETTVPSTQRPIVPVKAVPIIPQDRWVLCDKRYLRKRFLFDNLECRNLFVIQLLQYEELKRHHADIEVSCDSSKKPIVNIRVQTKAIDCISDLDKEYAKYADVIYAEILRQVAYELDRSTSETADFT